ncbi:hypothetical protein SLA2020_205580 [Shorea laevis]
MDLALKGLDFSWTKKKRVLSLAAFCFAGYGFYRVYQSQVAFQKRNRTLKILGSFTSVQEAVSDTAETIGIVSRDLKDFLQSESDNIPNSLKQISKIMRSDDALQSIIKLTETVTVGTLRGVNPNSSSVDQIMDKLFAKAGSGFASVVVGSFARNLVTAFFSEMQSGEGLNSNSTASNDSVSRWVNVVSGDDCRKLIGDCVQLFVSTAVAVYLEKTMHVNTYDEFFSGLTNPDHGTRMREMLVTACNTAVKTLVKTSHQVLPESGSGKNSGSSFSPCLAIDQGQEALSSGVLVDKLSATLANPGNRKFVLDLTGRITFETVRSFLEILLEKLYDGMKKCVTVAHEAVVESGLDVVRYVTVKSSIAASKCLSLCLHVLDGLWILVPA